MKALAVTVAYLIYDFVCCLFDKQVKIDNLIHHWVSAVGLGAGLAYERCGSELVAAMWVTQISSPLLHMREILKAMALGLQLVSAFWFYKIARMIMYKFSKRNKAKIVPSNL
ncbi:unnamed protein product [Withania somnifera]